MRKFTKKTTAKSLLMASFILAITLSLNCVGGGLSELHAWDSLQEEPTSRDTGLLILPEKVSSSMPVMDTAFPGNSLPPLVNLSYLMPPVADQGKQGSCAAFSLGYALKSYMEGKEENNSEAMQRGVQDNPFIMSPKYLYHTGKYYDSLKAGNDAWGQGGMYMEEALEYLKKIGVVRWIDYGYDPSKSDEDFLTIPANEKIPPEYLKPKAKRYKISSWGRLDRQSGYEQRYDPEFITKVKTQLASENVVPFGSKLNEGFFNLNADSGECMWHVDSWQQGSREHAGGHAMIAIGYDDNRPYPGGKGAVLIQNSWGKEWGDRGRCWVSYPTFGTYVYSAFYAVDAPNDDSKLREDTDDKLWLVSGFKIRHGDIIDAITPIYSLVDRETFEVYKTVDGKRIGGDGGGESIETKEGHFVKGIEFQRGLYFGAHEVAHLRIIYGELTADGLVGYIKSTKYGSGNYITSLMPSQEFMARESFVVGNIQALSKQHTSGEIFLNNIAIIQKQLHTPNDFSEYKNSDDTDDTDDTDDADYINTLEVAAQNGDPDAQVELGKCYLYGYIIDENPTQAAAWFAKAAQQQHPEGLYLTGYVFVYGIGIEEDIPVAITVLNQAKDAGNTDAAVLLGDLARNGFGDILPDYEAAIAFYGPAAEANNADAIYALSHMLLEGEGMPKSIDDAKEGLAEAAKLGHTAACVDLAILIVETEEDNAANLDRVMDLLTFAADNGNEDAIELINEIMAELN